MLLYLVYKLLHMNKLIVLVLGLAVFTSCEKKDEGPNMSYPTTFVSKQLQNSSPVRMFTVNGEVKDAALIKKFAAKWSSSYFLENKVTPINSTEKLVFTSQLSAEVRNEYNTLNYDVQKSGGDLILTSTKEDYVIYSDEHYHNLIAGISKYKPLIYDKQPISSAAGGGYAYKTKQQLFTSLRGEELHSYQMLYTLKSGTKDYYNVRSLKIANKFDPSGLALLKANDTLVVQEFIAIGVQE